METLIATAFGQYVNVQRGEADHLTKGAKAIFRSAEDGSVLSTDILEVVLCRFAHVFASIPMPPSFVANFPWLEPLFVKVFQMTEVAKSIQLMHRTAIGLIEARVKSQLPPKVCCIANS